ncbi:MAG: oxygenase MpaB family protein [Polyangiaceae bacterium]
MGGRTAPEAPVRRVVRVEAARARFGDRIDRLTPFLTRVDPLADAVISAVEDLPEGVGWRKIERALKSGIDQVEDPPPAFRAFFEFAEHVPVWVDWPTLDRGGSVLFRSCPVGGLVLGAKSLVYGYADPGGNKPLIMSGRLREQAARRLNETARFVQAVCRPGGLKPFADGYQITLKVRLMHARVRFMLLKSGRWNDDWGAPINQHDMAATTLLFSLVVLEGMRQFGMQINARDGDDYMQLWRYAGHLIGVDQEIQPTSEAEGHRLAEVIRSMQARPDDDSRALVRALMESGVSTGATSAAEKALGRRSVHFGYAVCRELVGDAMADDLGVERTSWKLAVQMLKRVVRATERVRTSIALADRQAIIAGSRYWDRVVAIGLQGATAEFSLPSRLAA